MRTQWIRIYSQEQDNTKHHSFYVGCMMSGGISDRVISFDIDERTTFTDLRNMVCWREQNGSYRRPIPLYAELLEAIKSCENIYDYSKDEQREFLFGVDTRNRQIDKNSSNDDDDDIKYDDDDIKEKSANTIGNSLPQIIQCDIEDEPIDQIIPPGVDLILVPLILTPKSTVNH